MSEASHPELDHSSLPDLLSHPPGTTAGHSNGTTKPQRAQNGFVNSAVATAQEAMAAINNHSATHDIHDTVTNGPAAKHAKAEAAKTSDELAHLAKSRQTIENPAATGQPLTHYHSRFYRVLSWQNPRTTAFTFAFCIAFIFAARYLNVIRYFFKIGYLTLGVTATAELGGQLAFGRGIATQFRPKRYFTIPKASLERLLDDLEQFINFFVIESQRIVFAENVYTTGAAFFASLISYFLIKFVPFWGLSLIATTVAFLGPLIYIKNKKIIDDQIKQGREMVNQQASQLKGAALQHTGNAAQTFQEYTKDLTAKTQETFNSYRGRSTSPEVKREFPAAPTHALPSEKKAPVAEPAS